jgi:hypothetical protein
VLSTLPNTACLPAGYTVALQRWVHTDPSHPPHVMSDHILLAAAVHGGLACEALMPLLNWWHIAATGWCCAGLNGLRSGQIEALRRLCIAKPATMSNI